jgi:hypothetical protein
VTGRRKHLSEAKVVSWNKSFFDPIILPSGHKLVTLRDAALYITKLPKAEHDAAEWQAAMEALLLVAESGGPTMFARIGVMRALNRHVEREFNPERKDTHWGRRKLARDR